MRNASQKRSQSVTRPLQILRSLALSSAIILSGCAQTQTQLLPPPVEQTPPPSLQVLAKDNFATYEIWRRKARRCITDVQKFSMELSQTLEKQSRTNEQLKKH